MNLILMPVAVGQEDRAHPDKRRFQHLSYFFYFSNQIGDGPLFV